MIFLKTLQKNIAKLKEIDMYLNLGNIIVKVFIIIFRRKINDLNVIFIKYYNNNLYNVLLVEITELIFKYKLYI